MCLVSQHFVEKQLTSLGAATFPPPSEATLTTLRINKNRVVAYVDLPNNYGVLVPLDYVCEVTKISSAMWHHDAMKIKQPVTVLTWQAVGREPRSRCTDDANVPVAGVPG